MSRYAFAFIPWVMFINNPSMLPPDGSTAQIAVAKEDCSRPTKVFNVEIASSPERMTKGLGNRKEPLKKNEGMLFIFPNPKVANFWMKDVHFPIQIGFFTPLGKLLKRHHMPVEEDPSNPAQTYTSEGIVLTALEVSPGALDGIKEGEGILCLNTPRKNSRN